MEMSAIAMQPRIVSTGGSRAARVGRPVAVAPVRRVAVAPGSRVAPTPRAAVGSAARAAEAPARLHLTRRGRAVLVLLALLVVLAGVMGGRAVAEGPVQAVEVTTHSVMAGETLWQIATGVAAPGEDVRDVVLRLQELNDLPDASLQAGQVLLLPVGS